MEDLIKKIESMSLEQFNRMMESFIEKTKKYLGIGKMMSVLKKNIETSGEPWHQFFNSRVEKNEKFNSQELNFEKFKDIQNWMKLKKLHEDENE